MTLARENAEGVAVALRKEDLRVRLFASEGKRQVVLALVLCAITLLVYNPVNRHDFVNYDDNFYVTQNLIVQHGLTWPGVKWAFTTFEVANWHPLTWLSHMLDCTLYGLKPAGHHFSSVLVHTLNVILLFLFLYKLTAKPFRSFVVAILFAVHPLNVESVAWVAERKNLLCTTFWLLSMLAYVRYARKPNWKRYLSVAILFALALMAKPMAVTMPFLLLLLDYWPLGRLSAVELAAAPVSDNGSIARFGMLLLEKVPLLALAAIGSLITIKAQQSGRTVAAWTILPLAARLKNAAVSYLAYIGKMFWPAKLAVMYPHPGISIPLGQAIAAALALIVITAMAIAARRKAYFLVGWLWYLGTMVPVIGLVQVGDQAMADRYAYVPLIGLFVMIVWGIADWAGAAKTKQKLVTAAAAMALVALVWQCSRQIGYWQNSMTLFSHAIAVTDGNFHAEVNLGGALEEIGRPDEAMQHFYAAVADNPKFGLAHYDIGIHLQRAGKLEDAAREYTLAVANERDPETQARGENNLAYCLIGLGRTSEAESHFRRAIELDPYKFNSHYGLGHLLLLRGEFREAAMHLAKAAAILPTELDYFDLGQVFEAQKKFGDAASAYQAALRLEPNFPDAKKRLESVENELVKSGTNSHQEQKQYK